MRTMTCPSTYLLVLSCCLGLFNVEPVQAKPTVTVFWAKPSDNNTTGVSVKSNLDQYSRAAEKAKSEEKDMIIFPEVGVIPSVNEAHLLESVLGIRNRRINPCKDPDNFRDRPMLYTLSCIAMNNSIVVMANTGIIKECPGDGKKCFKDGVYRFTTNVVFDKDGTMTVKQNRFHIVRDDPAVP